MVVVMLVVVIPVWPVMGDIGGVGADGAAVRGDFAGGGGDDFDGVIDWPW